MADTTKVDKKRKPDEELQKEDSSVVLIIREQEQEVPDFYVVPRAELNDQQWEVLEGYRTDSPGWDWVAVDGMLCTCFSQPMKGLEAPCMPEQVEHGSLGPYKLKHGYKAHKLMDLRVHRIYVLPCEG